jgi:hypothetical protein
LRKNHGNRKENWGWKGWYGIRIHDTTMLGPVPLGTRSNQRSRNFFVFCPAHLNFIFETSPIWNAKSEIQNRRFKKRKWNAQFELWFCSFRRNDSGASRCSWNSDDFMCSPR